jgi:hypothetical protein
MVAFILWLPYLITAMGNGGWSRVKIAGLQRLIARVKEARGDKTCQVSCNRPLNLFLAMVIPATVISYSFYDVYSEEGCQVLFPVFNQLRLNQYDLGFNNFTNVTLERIDRQMNDGEVGFNSTGLNQALQAICILNGIYYALRYVTMVAMRIALPLVMLDWSQGCSGLCFQIMSVLILLLAAGGLLGFPSAGQVVDVQDQVDFKFAFDLICFLVGSTSNNVVKVLGKPRQAIERCCRSIFRKPRPTALADDAATRGPSLLDLATPLTKAHSRRPSARVAPVSSARSSRANSERSPN